jgi:hypothetical protein
VTDFFVLWRELNPTSQTKAPKEQPHNGDSNGNTNMAKTTKTLGGHIHTHANTHAARALRIAHYA